MKRTQVAVGGVDLELFDAGTGEPVVLIQTALTADELLPLAEDPALAGYRRLLYHRRGYAGSSPVSGSGSITRDAADCRGLLEQISVASAHVVGLSYSGAVALQMSADAPGLVHSLTLIEPPPVHTPSAHEFRAANERLIRTRREHGAADALDEFLTIVIGPNWRHDTEEALPASAAQMERDVETFFDSDLPALLDWRFTAADARRIRCPVLYVGGSDSGPWFDEVRALLLEWLPDAEEVTIAGADHGLALTHPQELAAAVAAFLRRHPV